MTKSLAVIKYFDLLEKHPELFRNPAKQQGIEIITDLTQIKEWQSGRLKELKKEGLPTDWSEIGVLADDPWFWVIRDLVEFPDGHRNGYIRFVNRKSLDGGSNVVIVPRSNKKLVLVKHFRHETRDWSWEFPRGFAEPDLTAIQNAEKELREELGVDALQFELLSKVQGVEGTTSYFVADILDNLINVEFGEAINSFELANFSKVEDFIYSGKINDPFTVTAYFFLKQKNLTKLA